MNCHQCAKRIEGTRVRLEYSGGNALDGMTITCCANCVRLVIPERDITLPERISDPVAEVPLVTVELFGGDWFATCRECGRIVAFKDNEDDAELGAARHLARFHSGIVA